MFRRAARECYLWESLARATNAFERLTRTSSIGDNNEDGDEEEEELPVFDYASTSTSTTSSGNFNYVNNSRPSLTTTTTTTTTRVTLAPIDEANDDDNNNNNIDNSDDDMASGNNKTGSGGNNGASASAATDDGDDDRLEASGAPTLGLSYSGGASLTNASAGDASVTLDTTTQTSTGTIRESYSLHFSRDNNNNNQHHQHHHQDGLDSVLLRNNQQQPGAPEMMDAKESTRRRSSSSLSSLSSLSSSSSSLSRSSDDDGDDENVVVADDEGEADGGKDDDEPNDESAPMIINNLGTNSQRTASESTTRSATRPNYHHRRHQQWQDGAPSVSPSSGYLYVHLMAISSSIFGAQVDIDWSNAPTRHHPMPAPSGWRPTQAPAAQHDQPFAVIDVVRGQTLKLECTGRALGRLPDISWYTREMPAPMDSARQRQHEQHELIGDHYYLPMLPSSGHLRDSSSGAFVASEIEMLFNNLTDQSFTLVKTLQLDHYDQLDPHQATPTIYACLVRADSRRAHAEVGVRLVERKDNHWAVGTPTKSPQKVMKVLDLIDSISHLHQRVNVYESPPPPPAPPTSEPTPVGVSGESPRLQGTPSSGRATNMAPLMTLASDGWQVRQLFERADPPQTGPAIQQATEPSGRQYPIVSGWISINNSDGLAATKYYHHRQSLVNFDPGDSLSSSTLTSTSRTDQNTDSGLILPVLVLSVTFGIFSLMIFITIRSCRQLSEPGMLGHMMEHSANDDDDDDNDDDDADADADHSAHAHAHCQCPLDHNNNCGSAYLAGPNGHQHEHQHGSRCLCASRQQQQQQQHQHQLVSSLHGCAYDDPLEDLISEQHAVSRTKVRGNHSGIELASLEQLIHGPATGSACSHQQHDHCQQYVHQVPGEVFAHYNHCDSAHDELMMMPISSSTQVSDSVFGDTTTTTTATATEIDDGSVCDNYCEILQNPIYELMDSHNSGHNQDNMENTATSVYLVSPHHQGELNHNNKHHHDNDNQNGDYDDDGANNDNDNEENDDNDNDHDLDNDNDNDIEANHEHQDGSGEVIVYADCDFNRYSFFSAKRGTRSLLAANRGQHHHRAP